MSAVCKRTPPPLPRPEVHQRAVADVHQRRCERRVGGPPAGRDVAGVAPVYNPTWRVCPLPQGHQQGGSKNTNKQRRYLIKK